MNLVCNTASRDWYPCSVTLFVQIATFGRTILTESWAMGWLVSLLGIQMDHISMKAN